MRIFPESADDDAQPVIAAETVFIHECDDFSPGGSEAPVAREGDPAAVFGDVAARGEAFFE